ncbi:zinc finger protein JAGGED-like [Apium graveolens]|uniref:zinc finger protein JAGGED-like n=1 Tax=Apium graveolens TaxID=4045 RepID=UPI003D7910E0
MRPADANPLDLNNLPAGEDHTSRDQGALGGYKKKKIGGLKDDESGKVYECRFCSLKFGKSQALGGHMNRHRQERETETLNRARQLVFTNDSLMPPTPPPLHLVGGGQAVQRGGYHPHHQSGDPYRGVYDHPASRLFTGSPSSTILPPLPPPPPHSYMYSSPPPHLGSFTQSQYYNTSQHMNDQYLIGHVLSGTNTQHPNFSQEIANNFTCIGAPVGHGKRGVVGGAGDLSSMQQRLDASSIINRFQDGF